MDRLPAETTSTPPSGIESDGVRPPWLSELPRPRARDDARAVGLRPRIVAHPNGPATEHGQPAGPASNQGEDALIDVDRLVDYGWFVVRSLRRHVVGALVTAILTMTAVAVVANVWPKTYQIDGRLLVQHSSLVSSLVNPDRVAARDGSTPTLAAQEIVRGRDNVLALMKDTRLVEAWGRSRTPLLRLKDRAVALVSGWPTEAQRTEALAGLIEQRLKVGTNEEGTVSFVLTWPDANMGRQLVEQAMQSFLVYRRVTEAAAITDSIAILDQSARTLETEVSATLAALPEPLTVSAPRRVRRLLAPTGPPAEATVRLARLRSALEDQQRDVARLESGRAQQLAEAQARLSAALTIYTGDHPSIAPLRQMVARLSGEPAELIAARREARALEAEYDSLSTSVGVATASAEQARLLSQLDAAAPAGAAEPYRPASSDTDPIGLRLRHQMAELAAVRARGSAARAELASAQVGFKYQYSVVRPPQLPRQPIAPNIVAMLGAGALASLLLGLAFALTADLASGRLLEAWQVERLARAPISIRMPTL